MEDLFCYYLKNSGTYFTSPLEEFIEVKSLINVLIALLTFCCKLHDKYYPSIKVHISEAHNLHQLKFLLSNPILHSKNHCSICT